MQKEHFSGPNGAWLFIYLSFENKLGLTQR